jgi:hypothetical protein
MESLEYNVCSKCIGDAYLAKEIIKTGQKSKCSYCKMRRISISLGELANRVELAISQHYFRTSPEPSDWESALMRDKESDYDWERSGIPLDELVQSITDVSSEIADDIVEILDSKHSDFESDILGEETEFAADSYYDEKSVDATTWELEWESFKNSLKHESRYFNKSAERLLSNIFKDIETLLTPTGNSVIVDAGPNSNYSSIYRSRVFQSTEKLKDALIAPDIHLGPPPAVIASAGRMNARGISVFYGSTNPMAALAEVRPPVGSKVIIAEFEIIRRLRLLDLQALNKVHMRDSIFNPNYSDELERLKFLNSFSTLISRPVMPDDETFDYLATQAVADFLANHDHFSLDGIIFPSVQDAGLSLNVVLFQKSSIVEQLQREKNSNFSVQIVEFDDEYCWEDHKYTVVEELFENHAEIKIYKDDDYFQIFHEPSLKVNVDNITVHHINRVQYETEKHLVSNYKYTPDSSF